MQRQPENTPRNANVDSQVTTAAQATIAEIRAVRLPALEKLGIPKSESNPAKNDMPSAGGSPESEPVRTPAENKPPRPNKPLDRRPLLQNTPEEMRSAWSLERLSKEFKANSDEMILAAVSQDAKKFAETQATQRTLLKDIAVDRSRYPEVWTDIARILNIRMDDTPVKAEQFVERAKKTGQFSAPQAEKLTELLRRLDNTADFYLRRAIERDPAHQATAARHQGRLFEELKAALNPTTVAPRR